MLALKLAQLSIRNGFLRCLHQTGSVMLSKEIGKVHQHPDELGQSIKSAVDTLELFDALSQHEKIMNSELVMQSLKTLFTLQKSGNSSLQTSQIAAHPQFEKLCRDLRRASRSLEINDIIQSLKILSYIGIPANSNIMHILLNLLRKQINDISLAHIVFLDFLLRKLERTPLVEALRMALPMLFQIQLSSQIDHENVPELVELLTFAANNNTSDKCVMSIVSALTLHGESLKVDAAVQIVWALTELQNFKPSHDRLLHNCFNIISSKIMQLSFEKVDLILHKTINKTVLKFDSFYSEDLLDAAAQHAVQNDIGFTNAMFILKKFNKLSFVNKPLLDYTANKVLENPQWIKSSRPALYLGFLTAFSIANYTPSNWESIKPYLFENPIVRSARNELPWMKFNLELLSIGCYSKDLLEKVFDDDFLDLHLAREQNLLDYLQMLLLYQCTQTVYAQYDGKLPDRRFIDKAIELNFEKQQFPLKACLENIFGGEEYVGTKISTRFGQLIDHIIVFDKDQRPVIVNETATPETEQAVMMIEDIKKESSNIVAILACPKSYYTINSHRLKGVFHLWTQTLENLGVRVLPVNLEQWSNLPEQERLPYLEREVKFTLQR
ncbi:unnamed protein product [Hermetia illucens]|uniref:RAP domain-containing protein n=1 Tax=Hermetia illucens TaxID=343691 RepID=A0A7R8Z577_HERIL|nr:FAST kinase domain-containing protein 2, mitochondrial-like [Hermetia illucens]XP_037921955.1 FAST kinase domain-containing protein 2, mitochondrial-like [Hermetia illucens]CAD7093812.1 unnamed protein product [Hermetia illucens]